MNDYEAHLSSYDHSHKQRLKDMKAMVRDPAAAARARRQEQRAGEGVISIKLGEAASQASSGGGGGGGFKKGGFKKTGFTAAGFGPVGTGGPAATAAAAPAAAGAGREDGAAGVKGLAPTKGELVESDTEDEGYEMYDPRRPTD